MPKRPASTTISCPGCTTQFDSETHIPLIGSCGHSICSICTNEKKITACPVCHNPAGFLWKQKNELALELLTMMAEKKAKKSRLELAEEPKKKIPAILDPTNFDVVLKIVNQLQPCDFLKLAQTCKTMHNFCFNTKEIKIVHNKLFVEVSHSRNRIAFAMGYEDTEGNWQNYDKLWPQDYEGNDKGWFDSREKRKELQKYPFVFELSCLKATGTVTKKVLATIRSFLSEIPVKKIYKISTGKIKDWNDFIQFVKDFHPLEVDISGGNKNDFMPREVAAYFLQKEIKFTSYLHVDDDLILKSPLKKRYLPKSSISKETFEALVLRFAHSTEPIDWILGCKEFDFNPSTLFKKVLPFDHEGRVSKKRPLAFVKENEPDCFDVLRKDGKVIHCLKENFVSFNMILIKFSLLNPSKYPPCLKTTSMPVA